jgi:uncharacterized protein with WD repeat
MVRCTRCGQEKEPSEFYRDSAKRNGLRSWCKRCTIEGTMKARDPVKHRETRRRYYRRHREKESRENAARNKAVWRLARQYPEEFQRYYREELESQDSEPVA